MAMVTAFIACLGRRMGPWERAAAARSQTLSVPVTLLTKGEGVKGPGWAESWSAV